LSSRERERERERELSGGLLLPSLLHPGLAYMPMGTMGSNDGRKGGPIVLTCMYMNVKVNKYTKTVTLHYKFTTNKKGTP
jgi:hypothetical protein